jgi:hypothetical protein
MLNHTSPDFWSKNMKCLISQHIIIYPFFMKYEECKKLYENHNPVGITIVLHFLGILIMLENRETFDASTICKFPSTISFRV